MSAFDVGPAPGDVDGDGLDCIDRPPSRAPVLPESLRSLQAPAALAGQTYWLLGSLSGTQATPVAAFVVLDASMAPVYASRATPYSVWP